MVLLSFGGVLMSANSGPKEGIDSLILRATMFNPIVGAITLGAALAGTGLALPEAITRFLGFLGGAAGPAALFALGGALALQRLDHRTAVAACLITVVKLAVYPLLVWLILGRVMQLDAFWVNVGVLIASLPSAGNIYVLAQRYDADPKRVSAAILLSTLVSVVSFPWVAWLALDQSGSLPVLTSIATVTPQVTLRKLDRSGPDHSL